MTKKIQIIFISIVVIALGSVIVFSQINNEDQNSVSSSNLSTQEIISTQGATITSENLIGDELNTNNVEIQQLGVYTDYSTQNLEKLNGKTKIVFFHADWCPSCRAAEKDILNNEINGDIAILKADYDEDTDLREKYGIVQQTSYVLIDDEGELIKKVAGFTRLSQIEDWALS